MFRKTFTMTKKKILAAVLFLFGSVTVAFLVYMAIVSRQQFLLWKDCEALFATGDYQAAQSKLKQLVNANPSHEEGWRLLAKTDEMLDDYSDACLHWQRVHDLNMYDMEARKHLAECLMVDRQYFRAMKLYKSGFSISMQTGQGENREGNPLAVNIPRQEESEGGDHSNTPDIMKMSGALDASEMLSYAESVLMVGDKDLIPLTMERVREVVDNEKRLDFLDGLLKIRMGEFEKGHGIFKVLLERNDLSRMFRWRLEVILGGVISACGDAVHSEEHYLKAYAVSPKMSNRLLGEFYRSQNMLEKSVPYWKGELEFYPDNDYARMQLIETYGGMGDRASLEEFRNTLTPDNRSRKELGHYADAAIFLLSHDYGNVLETLKKCLCYYERDFYHVMRLCATLEQGGDLHLEEDLVVLRERFLADPFVKMVIGRLYVRMMASLKEKDVKTALWYSELMWSFTRMRLPEMRVAAKLLMADMFDKRNYASALELGKFCLSCDEQDKEVLRVLVMSSLATSDFVGCMDYAKRLGDQDPTALSASGNALAFVGQTRRVIETYEKLLKLKPNDALLLEYAWRLFQELGVEEGMSYVETLYGTGEPMNEIRLSCLRALHLLWRGDKKGFSNAAQKIMKKMTDGVLKNAECRYWRAVLLARSGRALDAMTEFKAVLQMGYANAFVFCEMSDAFAKTGDEHLMEALEIARSAVRLWPGWYVADCCLRRREADLQEMIRRKSQEGPDVEKRTLDESMPDKSLEDEEL